jgi:hypothetical protein
MMMAVRLIVKLTRMGLEENVIAHIRLMTGFLGSNIFIRLCTLGTLFDCESELTSHAACPRTPRASSHR